MAFFIEQLRMVLPILGFDLFRAVVAQPTSRSNAGGQETTFHLDVAGVRALARETDSGFIVLTDSFAAKPV